MGSISFLLVLAILSLCCCVEGKVRLTFTVRNYANPNNLDDRLRKCETFHLFGDHCDPMFQMSVYTTDIYGAKKLTLKREAGPFANKRTVRDVLQATATERFFPTTIEVDLDIHDHDVDEDQRIARFRRQFPVFETGQTELRLGADVRVEILVKIDCETDYYGQQCEVYCLPMPALWDCNPVTGARICNKPCEHGSCVLTNTSAACVCAAGWTGEFCKMPSESSLITSMILPEMPVNPFLPSVSTTTFNLEDDSNGDVIPPKWFLETSSPTGENAESEYVNEGESDDVFTYAPIISLGRMNYSATENSSDVSQKSNDSVMTITAVAFGMTGAQRPFRLIMLVTSVAVATWIVLMIVIGVLCYRRRDKKFGSNQSGFIWTNTNYGITPGALHKPYGPGYSKTIHEYENTIGSYSHGTRTPSTLSSSLSNNSRNTLPKARCAGFPPPPVVTGSKIRFAATTMSTSPPPGYSSCTRHTKGRQDWPVTDDQYEELSSDIGDYSIWEQDVSSKTPLTSSQVNKACKY